MIEKNEDISIKIAAKMGKVLPLTEQEKQI